MTKKAWVIFAVICLAFIGGMIFLSRSNQIDVSKIDEKAIQPANKQDGEIADHTYGNMSSKVVLIEYGDYECPGCGDAYPIIKQVVQKYQDKIGFIFRNFPLTSIHPNALASASAAEAVAKQGKFWEMHNKLYETQSSWENLSGSARTDYFVTLADSIGANGDTVRTTINDNDIAQKISYDQALGKKAGVTGTPSFYINGKNVGDQYYVGNQLVSQSTSGAALVWSNADAFDNLVIQPALSAAGIK